MIDNKVPVPVDEMNRVINLAEFDLDFPNLENNFKDLTRLAAEIAGTPISLVNLIDSYTQWTIAKHGLDADNMPREDSVCQYTIMSEDAFEVNDLSKDDRFKNRDYVTQSPNLRYYLGIPLTTDEGYKIGSLCVLDTSTKKIEPEKIELLTIIAREIVQRLQSLRSIKMLEQQVVSSAEIQKRVVHDIRGPIGGIVGLSRIIKDQEGHNNLEEVLEFIDMIYHSASSLLDLANEILTTDTAKNTIAGEQFNLHIFKERLVKLYQPQAFNKNINFEVKINLGKEKTPFPKNKLLQITGNLITNAIKFTPHNGKVKVNLDLTTETSENTFLKITVKDSGIGLCGHEIDRILNGTATSAFGTEGEQGFGFGLSLVKHLVDQLQGTMYIFSEIGEGTIFEISLPLNLSLDKKTDHQNRLQ